MQKALLSIAHLEYLKPALHAGLYSCTGCTVVIPVNTSPNEKFHERDGEHESTFSRRALHRFDPSAAGSFLHISSPSSQQ